MCQGLHVFRKCLQCYFKDSTNLSELLAIPLSYVNDMKLYKSAVDGVFSLAFFVDRGAGLNVGVTVCVVLCCVES